MVRAYYSFAGNTNTLYVNFFPLLSISEPGAPKNVVAHWESLNTVKIDWQMPNSPNGYILAYNVQWASNSKDAEW